MWMWPLDSAMEAIVAHRAPERLTDRTCTQIWVWMINKCRRRMNGGEGYKTTEILQRREGEKEKAKTERRRKRGSWETRGVGNSHPRTRSPFSLGERVVWSCVLGSYWIIAPTPKPAVALSEPNLWTHSLQINCKGSTRPRFCPLLGPVRKSRPYNKYFENFLNKIQRIPYRD